jgi:putative transposase
VSDKLSDGRTIRILTVIDQYTRECVWVEADRSMSGAKVVDALTRAIVERGAAPDSITPGQRERVRGESHGSVGDPKRRSALFHPPRRPVENGFIESFNGRLRDECLNVEWFMSLEEAREKLVAWRDHYNHRRPHSALDDRSPAVFAALHGVRTKRFALCEPDETNGEQRQGFAAPACAALDPARRLSEDIDDQGEALFRIARTQNSLLSICSDFQARNPGSGGP